MPDYIETMKGEAISLPAVFKDANGDALDLTGATVTVREASATILESASVAVTDASNGAVSVTISEAQADQLPEGLQSWFRLEAQLTATVNVVTPKIWILVK